MMEEPSSNSKPNNDWPVGAVVDRDLCIQCGLEVESQLYGGKCTCGALAVHQVACDVCGRICGTITNDDYCGPARMICPDCMDRAREKCSEGKPQ